jgi:hypothetical protein
LPRDDAKKAAAEIADALGEKQHGPRRLVREVVERCGVDFAREVLKDTEEVMRLGGMLTAAADRLRTKGGVFFYLARGRMSDEVRHVIFPPRTVRNRRKPESTPTPPQTDFNWAERLPIVRALLKEQGEVRTVKITLIGRPGKVETRKETAILTMSHSAGVPTFPRGVPQPPTTPTLYTVYVATKQWKRVEAALKESSEDVLILEGMCAFDPDLQAVAVYTIKATTKFLEAAKRQDGNGKSETRKAPEQTEAAASASPPADIPQPNIPAAAPANVAQKLRELHAAAELYRQRIAALELKPAGQQFGLEMTQKLLKNVEDEISSLEAQYA